MEPTATPEQLKNREIWATALESGKFEQAGGSLGSLSAGMCCLGVGCFVLGIPFDPTDSFPPPEFCKKVGLPHDDGLYAELDGTYDGGSLVNDNDERKLSFPEIAQVIKTNETLWAGSAYQDAVEAQAIKDRDDEDF